LPVSEFECLRRFKVSGFIGFTVSGVNAVQGSTVQGSKTECHPEHVSGSDSVFVVGFNGYAHFCGDAKFCVCTKESDMARLYKII